MQGSLRPLGISNRAAACFLAVFSLATSGFGQDSPADGGRKAYENQVRPLLARYCVDCHSGEKSKGDLRLDRLSADFTDASSREKWRAVVKRVMAGEMPPESKPRPPEKELQAVAAWITAQVDAAERAQRTAEGRVVLRRLNRVEYENTIHDLLGIDLPLKDLLPLDASADGFDNVGEALHVSSFLLERYLEAADAALNVAIANGPQPPVIRKRFSLKESHQVRTTSEKVFRKSNDDDRVVMFSSSPWQAISLSGFYPPDRGNYRFRISAAGVQSDGKPVTYRLDAGTMGMTGKSHLVGYFDAPADRSNVVEFIDYLEPRSTIRILPYGLASAQTVHKVGAEDYDGPGLGVDWVEVEGPLYDAWPPESHRCIFGDLPQKPAPIYNFRNRVEVASDNPRADAERILRQFARRAFRRTATEADVQPFVALVEARLAEEQSFEQAMRAGLVAILVSPEFLFLREPPGTLDEFALASRLSYFLWSSAPDEELLKLAEQGQLTNPETLHTQVERLLTSPKSQRFVANFVGQWLGLRDIDFTIPSHILYPDYDEMLKASMVRETELFFAEVHQQDLSLTNFVASDFTFLNGRLAKHYGIPGIEGWEFQKVVLPEDSHRGGVLTMASVLKVTANGTTTSPVTRGAWVMDRILGKTPPRPPENVAAIDPDIRGATTIREQLAKHRQIESCASCHQHIDPPGFALESFDVIGGYREFYRSSGNGKPVIIDGQKQRYLQGKPVDPSDTLPDGRSFRNIDEFKQLLLADKDQLARALTVKLVTYATGAAPTESDQPQVDAIVEQVRAAGYGLRSLVHAIVRSGLFGTK